MLPTCKINSTVTIFAVVFSLLFAATAIAGKNKHTEPDDILTEEEVEGLMFMREEEKLARDSYLVLFEKWGNPIFDNISESEQRHMDAMKSLIVKYGLEDPVKDESVIGGYANSDLQELFDDLMERGEESMTDALYVGALIEETDIEDIHHEIELAEQEDIISTYESLVCGSGNHLRAFVGQLDLNGAPYTPTVIPEEVFLAIINTPFERDCGTSVRKGNRPK